ncbi:glycerol-3-phosphate dehydrogenase [Amphritea balenae]|uniref:Glycerol-3-phosphate dehydrogenase n=1 Tax=Amphritea balenae TaxID=452629 RepID=A0A3P1SWN9_9GAMM|nr:glycerol-3-phosphate dehydrogenase [Amphritea balenae]RRD01647.1 glycerol-3-phosphate dehydrogenase [Amphritea balenae]GGK55310.1 glycerol-3-phosphate dehydrogenase [Amphritea balenae]
MSLKHEVYDLLVVGGGINGAGIAADAAGRGLSVILSEMNDLGSATSSNSSKLIHGGLRYLEYYEFRLVREALAEREVLLKNAPHIIWPLRFRLPHRPHLRPALMIRAGLFLYDHLAKRVTLPSSKGIKFGSESPLKSIMKRGFEYSDGWVDDARLVTLNALAAQAKGATIRTRSKCISATRSDGLWTVRLQDNISGQIETLQARSIVNASGPWVSSLFDEVISIQPPKKVRLVKGSHIIVPRIHDEAEAYILQNEDSRIVFVIPYEDEFSLIGTTDKEYYGDPAKVAIDQDEIDYLVDVTNQHFRSQISASDVVRTYSGVRPLLDDEADSAQAVTRDYTFEVDAPSQQAPLISIFGGKITTYRKLSEAAVDKLCEHFPKAGKKWTADARLPGGDFTDQLSLRKQVSKQYPWLPTGLVKRFVRTYGTLTFKLLEDANQLSELGLQFADGFYEAEILYLINHEWALTTEDIIWRRTKQGLRMSDQETKNLTQYLDNHFNQNIKTASCL